MKRHRIAEWIRKHDPHICCLKETNLNAKDLHRLKVKGWKQIFSSTWTGKKSWCSNTHIRQNRIQKKGHKERTRWSLHNPQRKNPRRHKHCKYICTQHRNTQIHKENLGGLQKKILTATQL